MLKNNVNIKTLKYFIIIRLVLYSVLSVFLILLSSLIQYIFVRLFGYSGINYIFGGYIGISFAVFIFVACSSFINTYINSLQMCCFCYENDIIDKDLDTIITSYKVYRKSINNVGELFTLQYLCKNITYSFNNDFYKLFDEGSLYENFKRWNKNILSDKLSKSLIDYSLYAGLIGIILRNKSKETKEDKFQEFVIDYIKHIHVILKDNFSILFGVFISYYVLGIFSFIFIIINNGFLLGVFIYFLFLLIISCIKETILSPYMLYMVMDKYFECCGEEIDKSIEDYVSNILNFGEDSTDKKDSIKMKKELKENDINTKEERNNTDTNEEIMLEYLNEEKEESKSESVFSALHQAIMNIEDTGNILDFAEKYIEDDSETETSIKDELNNDEVVEEHRIMSLSDMLAGIKPEDLEKEINNDGSRTNSLFGDD